jgi:hypothetical protein
MSRDAEALAPVPRGTHLSVVYRKLLELQKWSMVNGCSEMASIATHPRPCPSSHLPA